MASYRGWLRQAGVTVADDTPVEISPLFALDAEELVGKLPAGLATDVPVYLDSSGCFTCGTLCFRGLNQRAVIGFLRETDWASRPFPP